MDLGLHDKKALICAGSRGLGRAVALELAREGADVAFCGRDPAAIADTGEAINALGRQTCTGHQADLGSTEAIDRFVLEATQRWGTHADIVVWNSGGPPAGPLLELEPSALEDGFAQHMRGALHLFRRTIPAMVEQGFGRVIAVTSLAVKQPLPGLGISNAIRAGLHGLLKTLAAEIGEHGVTVNAVLPGYTHTSRLEGLANARAHSKGTSTQTELQAFASSVPLGRVGRPEEFAAAVAFLASERASYIHGISLAVDGGCTRNLL